MKKERGFTLIELLVVIAILAVLFGLTALALNGVGDDAEAAAMDAEKDVVQTAIDVCLAIDTCTLTENTTSAVVVTPTADGLGAYLRRTSKYQYTWDADGNITSQVKP